MARCFICGGDDPALPIVPPSEYRHLFKKKWVWMCRWHNGTDKEIIAMHAFTGDPIIMPARGHKAPFIKQLEAE